MCIVHEARKVDQIQTTDIQFNFDPTNRLQLEKLPSQICAKVHIRKTVSKRSVSNGRKREKKHSHITTEVQNKMLLILTNIQPEFQNCHRAVDLLKTKQS